MIESEASSYCLPAADTGFVLQQRRFYTKCCRYIATSSCTYIFRRTVNSNAELPEFWTTIPQVHSTSVV